MITLVQQYFSQSAALHPEKIAVSCGDDEISYSSLEYFSNAFATELAHQGIGRGQLIPFFMEKSINSIKSILSILKADCAYIPIDAHSPAQRMQAILKASQSKYLIVDNKNEQLFRDMLPDAGIELINIETFTGSETVAKPYKNLSIDMAYVLFTSGSTGTPKGVMIPHKAIIDYIDWCIETYQLTEDDVIANHAPLYFDNSTFDLYTAFKTGATLQLVPGELSAVLPRVVKWLNQKQVTTFFCVPSVLTLLLKSRRLKPDSFPKLRHIICAGETLPVDVLRQWMNLYPQTQFTNMYGPTEITVDCSYHIINTPPAENCRSIPIGKARNNMELFIRKDDGSLSQRVNDQGELLVRGSSVAYGYLGDSERTQAAFIQNPLNPLFHDPLYCTGDHVRLTESRDFEFLGRKDEQIKYLGHRIELGEIEAILTGIQGVVEGVVIFNRQQEEIAAAVILEHNYSLEELHSDLKTSLPNYMLPTKISLSHEEIPRTANGKYDRKAVLNQIFRERSQH